MRPQEMSGPEANNPDGEQSMVERIAHFSESIRCVAIITTGGAVMHAHGDPAEIAAISAALPRFHARCAKELDFIEKSAIGSETVSWNGKSALIGPIPGFPLVIALTVSGEQSRSDAAFLFDLALAACSAIAQRTGALAGCPVEPNREPIHYRTSWFGAPRLIAKGNFVGKKAGKSFHLCSCTSMHKAVDGSLEWFEKRTDAIRAGLLPCKLCNP